MKNVFKVLGVTEKDNVLTAFAKGGVEGYIKTSAVILPILGAIAFIGKGIQREQLKKFEDGIEEITDETEV